ncbi:carboxymuconolactone decarboxylase family protein [Bradyrhizobium vignae]|uniref:Carboxymuconolactone decarboxylase family protein n=1 Tax=Bradyrhizobium vignae TaxID=1549949 RepID=A0ABS4A1Y0_9BRAD|nr:carboxymuconolactone decarboxylase family protein [Bradyrhizobium vignae]MBP0114393.1 carboxymuconolactone decarboxylase family protein [Bradyrhizobium vignae]
MRLSTPRIAPLSDAELTPEQIRALEPYCFGNWGNITRTLAQKPEALSRFTPWLSYFLSRYHELSPRVKEMVILRTGFLCKSGYEWGHHVVNAMRVGVTEDEIVRIKEGSQAGWAPADAVLIQAADELHHNHFISDATWAELRRHYSEGQCMDVVYTIAYYTELSMVLNTFGVQLEQGLKLDPDLKGG